MTPENLEAYLKEHTAWGYDLRRVERAEIQELEPALTSDGDFLPEWGLSSGEEGSVEATEAARLLVADAQAKGARLVTAGVTDLLLLSDDDAAAADNNNNNNNGGGKILKGIKTSTGEIIEADHVVLAAGVGSAPLCASVGITVPISSPAGMLIHTKPVETRLLNTVIYAKQLHLRQTVDGRILSGSGFAGGDPGPDPSATAKEVFARAKAAFKPSDVVDGLELDYFTVGYRPTPKDGLPIIGETGINGLSIAVMHSGVTNAAIVGQLLSEYVLTGKKDPSLDEYSLKRFSNLESA